MTISAHDPATEAAEILGPGVIARVLEPSRPAVDVAPYFADDPATADPDDQGLLVITPTSGGDRTWEEVVAERPELREWAAQRWLAARPSLPHVPPDYGAARDGYHRLAYSVVAEARRAATTKFGLRYTRGGFGTPFFGADEQVRVENGILVHQTGDTVATAPITTLRAAADFVGVVPGTQAAEHDSPPLGDLDEDLGATTGTGEFLGAWFGFAWAALEELRLTPGGIDVERTQLWPGHFDPALAMGDAGAGSRATYGASPGDWRYAEPYLYIGPWGEIDTADPFWNETSFPGASLHHRDLREAKDPVAAATEFFRAGHARLHGTG